MESRWIYNTCKDGYVVKLTPHTEYKEDTDKYIDFSVVEIILPRLADSHVYEDKEGNIKFIEPSKYKSIIKNEVVIDYELKRSDMIQYLDNIKNEYINRSVVFKHHTGVRYIQKSREYDQAKLNQIVTMLQIQKLEYYSNWKVSGLDGKVVFINLSLVDILNIVKLINNQVPTSLMAESKLISRINTASDELFDINIDSEYDKLFTTISSNLNKEV